MSLNSLKLFIQWLISHTSLILSLCGFSSTVSLNLFKSIILFIVNTPLSTGVFPESLKSAMIRPKHINLDPYEIKNYRRISNLTFISKIIEKCAHIQLTNSSIKVRCSRKILCKKKKLNIFPKTFDFFTKIFNFFKKILKISKNLSKLL